MFRDLFTRLVKVSWASSINSLQYVLESIADTPGGANSYKLGKLSFEYSREERQELLKPIINKLKILSLDHHCDTKLLALIHFIEEHGKNQKIIIFCERRATVVYLCQKLKQILSSLNIAATIEQSEEEDQKFRMKDSKEIEKMIKQFAPQSNQSVGKYPETYDIFISTDAHGVGVNMQDASIVINYDIDWTPIGPVQRAGRILRFWHSPRTIKICTFVPTLSEKKDKTEIDYDLIKIQKRWKNLVFRHQESSKIIDLPVLTTQDTQSINISELASKVTITSGTLDIDKLADLDISPYYQHTAKLQINRSYAASLGDDLISAKMYEGKEPLLYMLLLHKQKYHGIFYNPVTKQLTEPEIIKILNNIACEENTEIAHVDYDFIEKLSDICLSTWCEINTILPDDVERICSLYLKPNHETDNLEELFVKATGQ